jgi:acyl-CoA reductase-like NAD-dependent aldehyde dehydrogenase
MGSINGDSTTKPTLKDDAGNLCVPCFIEGKPIIQPSSANFPITSARQEQIIHYGQNVTAAIATKAVESAAATFKTYKATPVHERRKMLLRAADLFEKKAEESIYRQMLETSCDAQWAGFNVHLTVECIREVAGAVEAAVTGAVPSSHHSYTTIVFREAIGTALLIPP